MESLLRKPSDRREAASVGNSHLPKVEDWSMGSRMKAQLVCDALTMAIWQRPPKVRLIYPKPLELQLGGKGTQPMSLDGLSEWGE
jgi:hypothetical protein